MQTILCIEDEKSLCDFIVEELEDAGYMAYKAYDGVSGLALIHKHHPDLVISDITMPNMGGDELLVELRENYPELAAIPFIFLTALSDRQNILEGLRLGADDYLTKPIDFEMLLTKVDALLRLSERQSSASQLATEQTINKLDAATNVDGVAKVLLEDFAKYGIEYLAFGGPPMPGGDVDSTIFIKSCPQGAWEYYVKHDFIHADPVVWHGMRMQSPFHWSDISMIPGREDKGREIMRTAARFGMHEGFVVPIHAKENWHVLASFSGHRVRVPQMDFMAVSIIVHYAFNHLRSILGDVGKRPGELTMREKEVVQWVAQGKTTDDIAKILGISPRTVIMHLENASAKLNTSNRANLVAEAIRYKQIVI